MVEIYLFEYNEIEPFTRLLHSLRIHHYKNSVDREGGYQFTIVSANIPKTVNAGLYSFVLCLEQAHKISDDDSDYRYLIVPRAVVSITDDGAIIQAEEFSTPWLEEFGLGEARGIDLLSNSKIDIRARGVRGLFLPSPNDSNTAKRATK